MPEHVLLGYIVNFVFRKFRIVEVSSNQPGTKWVAPFLRGGLYKHFSPLCLKNGLKLNDFQFLFKIISGREVLSGEYVADSPLTKKNTIFVTIVFLSK